jgi:DNA-binding transcriptional ArsR family regulator
VGSGVLSRTTGEVLVELAEYSGEETRPSVATLAAGRKIDGLLAGGLGLDRASVIKHLNILEELGLIEREGRPGRTTLFHFRCGDEAYPSPMDDGCPSRIGDPSPSPIDDPNVHENNKQNAGSPARARVPRRGLAGEGGLSRFVDEVLRDITYDLAVADGIPADAFGDDGELAPAMRRALAGVIREVLAEYANEPPDADVFIAAAEYMGAHPQQTDYLAARYKAVLRSVILPRWVSGEGVREEPLP